MEVVEASPGASVVNSTFSGNRAGFGGGAIDAGATGAPRFTGLVVINSTLSGNNADSGGGIFVQFSFVGVKNTILVTNNAVNCSVSGPESDAQLIDSGYNISDDSTCGFAKTGSANNGDNVDPLLSPGGLADNGGPTQTIALQSGSPAIDAIPVADCTDQASPPNPITTDQRGFPRPDAKEQVCDIGAYEFQDLLRLRGSPGNRTATARASLRSTRSSGA